MRKLLFSLLVFPVLLMANNNFRYCGGYYEDGSRTILLLDQTLISDPSLYPFFNCKDELFCLPFGNSLSVDSYDNLDEWRNYFDKRISKEELRENFYVASFLDFDKFAKDAKKKDYQAKNILEYLILKASNSEELIQYFWFAKQCELIYRGKYELENSWFQGEGIATSEKDIKRMYEEAISLYKNTTDAFLKNRIGFQIVRLAFEMGEQQLTNEMFDTYMKYDDSSRYIYYRAMERNATMLHHRGKSVESLQQFTQVFENLQDRRDAVYLSLQYLPMRGLDLSNHPNENELLHFTYGFRENIITEIEELIKINPNSAYAEVLAMRYFDTLHEAFFVNILNEHPDIPTGNALTDPSFIVKQQLENPDVKNKDLWLLFKGLLEVMSENYEEANATFAKSYVKKDYRNQAAIFTFVLKLLNVKGFDKFQMNTLYLEMRADKNLFGNHAVRSFFFRKLADMYAENEQKIMAEFLSYTSKHYAKNIVDANDKLRSNFDAFNFFYEQHKFLEIRDLMKLKKIITVTSRTKLENFMISLLPQNPEDFVNEMIGTYYLRENDLESAISHFEEIKHSKKYYREGIRNSLFSAAISEYFNVSFFEQSDRFHEQYKQLLFPKEIKEEMYIDNKLILAKTLLKLESLAKTDPENSGAYYYMLGNAWYNLSELGWFVNTLHYLSEGNDGRNYILGYDEWDTGDSEFLERSAMYYDKAIETAKSDELKARATFFKAKTAMCFDSKWSNSKREYLVYNFCGEHAANFETLTEEYKDTRFYEEIIKECTYFASYLNQR